VFNLKLTGPVAPDGVYRIRQHDLATVQTSYHAPKPGQWMLKWDERDGYPFNFPQLVSNLPLPHVETEYLSPGFSGRTELCHVTGKGDRPDTCDWGASLLLPWVKAGDRLTRDVLAGPAVLGRVLDRPLASVMPWEGKPLIFEPYFESAYTEREAALGSGDGSGGLLLVGENGPVVKTRTRITRGSEQVCDQPGVLPSWDCWIYGSGSYRIVVDTEQSTLPTSTRTTTEWTLQHDVDVPAVPLVLAEYKPSTDLYNTVRDRRHKVPLRVGYQPGGPPAPANWSVQAWATYDDGVTWKRVYAGRIGPSGSFAPELDPPHRHNGYVGLRLRADDGKGNAIDQTMLRAYKLR
jgi:hypothetical protein